MNSKYTTDGLTDEDMHINKTTKLFLFGWLFFSQKIKWKKIAWRSVCGLKSPPSFSPQLQKNLVELYMSSLLLTSFVGKNRCAFELKKKKKVFVY